MTRQKKPARRTVSCDPEIVAEFDYSGLSPEFEKLSKPAKRALLNNGIRTPKQLSKHDLKDVMKFHGIGPGSLPVLKAALRKSK